MKRIASLLSLLVVMTFGISSCKKDPVQPNNQTGNSFYDPFDDDRNGWAFADPDGDTITISNGQLYFRYFNTQSSTSFAWYNTNMPVGTTNFTVETRLQSDNKAALMFGNSNNSLGYTFYLSGGYFSVYDEKTLNTNYETLIDWTASSAIDQQGWNELKIVANAQSWEGYINGTKVFTLPARPLSGSRIGLMIDNDTRAYYDYIRLSW